ncbi:antitoxin YezG family protein [Paenibacillus polymyxa]|uniref:antitoxin YezG family protein n=1 Tax=Paenibacillus polymyxa TaxID=1406 RepID=UPI00211D5705|nr:antitoxin YezG family protein [Paenibacillus polymyxa]
MNDERLEILYQQIVEVIVDMIPKEWYKVCLYGEIVEGAQTAYFYFYPEGSGTVVYIHNIPGIYMVSESDYSGKWNE